MVRPLDWLPTDQEVTGSIFDSAVDFALAENYSMVSMDETVVYFSELSKYSVQCYLRKRSSNCVSDTKCEQHKRPLLQGVDL